MFFYLFIIFNIIIKTKTTVKMPQHCLKKPSKIVNPKNCQVSYKTSAKKAEIKRTRIQIKFQIIHTYIFFIYYNAYALKNYEKLYNINLNKKITQKKAKEKKFSLDSD